MPGDRKLGDRKLVAVLRPLEGLTASSLPAGSRGDILLALPSALTIVDVSVIHPFFFERVRFRCIVFSAL